MDEAMQEQLEPTPSTTAPETSEDEDHVLVQGLRSEGRDVRERAATELVAKYGPLLQVFVDTALRHRVSWDLRDDLVFSALRKAMANIDKFAPTGARRGFRNWLWKVARNLVLDYLKSKEHRQRLALRPNGPDETLDSYPGNAEEPRECDEWVRERAAVMRAVAKMSGRNRQYGELFLDFPDETDREFIAEQLGVEPDNERKIRSRMLKQLRELLEQDGFNIGGGQVT